MNKLTSRILWMTAGMAALFACTRTAEEDVKDLLPAEDLTSIEAYFAESPEVKTSYDIGSEGATFSWSDGDNIDVSVYNASDEISSYVVFKRADAGSENTTVEDTNNATSFTDGQDGNRTFKSLGAKYVMDKWAFYPSRVDEAAQSGGYAPDWCIEDGKLYMELPSSVTPPAGNPLAVVPMVGKKDGSGKYAFTQLTGVLAFTIDGLPDGADFISLTHEDVALTGSFEVTETERGAVIEYGKVVAGDDAGLTLHFSGAGTKATFYFSLPVGIIPAGLVLTVGREADPDSWMTKTTKSAVTIRRGTVMKVNVEIPYVPVDQQWEYFADAEFLDSFLWGQHAAYTNGTRVAVTLERSALHPEKYRINNPYTVANAQFGYTPYSTDIEADDYFVFTIEDGKVKYGSFLTGIEDKDSDGKPMMITYRAANASRSYVVSSLKNGDPAELLIGALYSDPNNAGYMYSRDTADSGTNAPTIHLYVAPSTPETWTDLCEVQYKDDFIFNNRLGYPADTYITLQAQVSDLYEGHYRIPNPYPLLAAQLGYTIPDYVTTTPDEYLFFNVADDKLVYFKALHAGINLDQKDLTITHPSEISGKSTAKNVIGAFQGDGTPDYVQLAPIYHQTGNTGYLYSRDGSDNIIRIVFPEVTETWTSLGTGRFRDEEMWKKNSFAPYDVEVEIWRSDADANRYRVANPYTVGNTAFKRTAAETGADEYMYLQVDPSNSQVSFGSLITGMTWNKSGSPEQDKSSVTCNWVIADKADTKTVLNKDISASRIVSGSADSPGKMELNAAYYAKDNATYFYTNSLAPKYLWFPGAYHAGETWTDFSEGTYIDGTYDGNINSTDAIGTVAVTIQQSSVDPNRFRIANPYRAKVNASYLRDTYDEYLYVNCSSTTSLAYMEPFRPGVRMNEDPKELAIWHPVTANVIGQSSYGGSDFAQNNVVAWVSGIPKQIRLGCYYFDIAGPTYSYRYTRQGSGRPDSERIFITFDIADKAKVVPARDALKLDFDNPVETVYVPAGTLEKVVIKVTGLDAEELAAARIRLYEKSSGWMTGDYLTPDAEGVVTMTEFSSATVTDAGIDINYRFATRPRIGSSIRFLVQEVEVSGVSYPVVQDARIAHYPFAIVNYGGDTVNTREQDETVASFRIPALVTSKDKTTLIAAYDVRYDNSTDLQGDIDVGYKRSTDGGNTWSDLGLAMDMGTYGYGTPEAFSDDWKNAQQNNGIGDPALLVDETTGDILCFAIWAHGHKGSRLLGYAGTGFEIEDTPQQMMVRSSDNGATWSEPVNLTRQIKKKEWRGTFQGPGRGITMKDGTLVLPYQHQEPGVVGGSSLCSGIIYSKDHGLTWHIHNYARTVTSECTVAEIEPGVLMLNMRDETNSRRRAVYTTANLGRSWTKHASDQTIPEPTCEASLLHLDADKNALGKDILLFSNPNNGESTGRSPMAIKASLDHGMTWPYVVTLTSNKGGYSCLSMIDENTVGILYEENLTNIVFQAIPLTDIVNN